MATVTMSAVAISAVLISAILISAVPISGGKGEKNGRGESINSKIGSKDY
jgi:hypothetical protein